MKHKLFFTTLSLGMTTAFLPLALQAADDPTSSSSPASSSSSQSLGQGATGKSASSISGQSQKFMRLSQLTGSSVKNTSGESLGQINDFVVDPSTGRIEFAVISLKEGGNSGKLTAIPWTLVRPSGEGQNLVANIDKDKLSSAQTFDRSQWPDMSQENWGQTVYSHYGLQWQDRSSAGGRVPLGGSDTGTGVNSTRPGVQGSDTDNSTAPDGKGTFQQDKPSKKFGTDSDSSSTSPSQAKDKDSSSTSPQSKDKDSLK
jgi:sporulation protein YlmC with PRC-barrel domain